MNDMARQSFAERAKQRDRELDKAVDGNIQEEIQDLSILTDMVVNPESWMPEIPEKAMQEKTASAVLPPNIVRSLAESEVKQEDKYGKT